MNDTQKAIINSGLPLTHIEVKEYNTVYKEVTWRVEPTRLVSVDKNAIAWYDGTIKAWRLNYTDKTFEKLEQALGDYSKRKWGII